MSGHSGSPAAEGGGAWERVGARGELREGSKQYGELGSHDRVLLARLGGKIYATQANCGHMRFPLADGKVEGTILTCPLHKARFDLATGANVGRPQVPWILTHTKMGRGILSVRTEPLRL